jgi:pimeloyl-ACP methyl ester carboxylesterase
VMRVKSLFALITGLALASAGVLFAPSAVGSTPSVAPSLIAWSTCTTPELKQFECGTLTVPRDWSNPAVGTFELAVIRSRSTGTAKERIGSLFINPGGPGGSGLEVMPLLKQLAPQSVQKRFDLVSWDPRGIGMSKPAIDCEPAQWSFPPAVGEVDWDSFAAGVRETVRKVNTECLARFPDVAPYVGTNNVVRDLDALRASVGDKRLNYWGASYGSRIGYVYALAYPDRFRALLFDGPVTPRGSIADFTLGVSTAADPAVGFLFENFPGTKWRYLRVLRALQQQPLQLSPTRTYTQWNLGFDLNRDASSQGTMPQVAQYLKQLEMAIFGSAAEQRKAKAELLKFPFESPDAMAGLTAMVNCIDYSDRMDEIEMNVMGAEIRYNAPITGWVRAVEVPPGCLGLETLTPDPVPLVQGNNWSPGILILATTRDSVTPYRWATAMANAFRSAKLVTYVGNQHVIFGVAQSPCVDSYASSFLIKGEVPRLDVACNNINLGTADR